MPSYPLKLLLAATFISLSPSFVSAQTPMPPPGPAHPGSAHAETIPSLFVLNAKGAKLDGNTLTLNGVSANSIIFADRPTRAAGHIPTRSLVDDWSQGDDSFAKTPPNATVSVAADEGKSTKEIVVTLKSPKLDGETLIFDVNVIQGDIQGANGAATVFVDIIGMPLTPYSYAGAARRAARRAYWYRAPHYYAPPPPPPIAVNPHPVYPYYHPYYHPYYRHPYYRPIAPYWRYHHRIR
ncbi:MAG: hypothetical protein ACR2OJ_18260 [Hyphomicrobiales bacterium]